MRQPSEQSVCPRNGITQAGGAALCGGQVEKASEGIWDAEQANRHPASRWSAGIARQPFFPGEAILGTLGTRKGRRRDRWAG